MSLFDKALQEAKCESPMEKLLLGALEKIIRTAQELGFEFDGQKVVEPYRLDFAFWSADGRKLDVEVDGHEYHDKTQEQAGHDRRRDRFITLLGWRAVRFTGREVYEKAPTCANEVLLHLKHLTAVTTGQAKLAESICKTLVRLTNETDVTNAIDRRKYLDNIFKDHGWLSVAPGIYARLKNANTTLYYDHPEAILPLGTQYSRRTLIQYLIALHNHYLDSAGRPAYRDPYVSTSSRTLDVLEALEKEGR